MENDSQPPSKNPRIKRKVACDWIEDVFKLISLVETEKCLWDAADESYHNKTMRVRAWQNIAQNFEQKYAPAEIKAKWSNLRIQFRSYAARAKTKSGQGAIQTPKWRFFNAMRFVGHAEKQQTQGTTSNLNFEPESEGFSTDTEYVSSQESLNTKRLHQPQNTQIVVKEIAATMREAVTVMKERGNNPTDPNITFANYLASELNTLSIEAAALVRKKITIYFMECVEEERKKF